MQEPSGQIGTDAAEVTPALLGVVRRLAERGFLLPKAAQEKRG